MMAVGTDANGRQTPVPIFSTNADVIGEMKLTINSQGYPEWSLTAPPVQEYPVMRIAVFDAKRRILLGYNEIPMVPGIYHSHVHMSFFAGLSTGIRALSNLAGTVLLTLSGVDLGINWINRNPATPQ